MIETTPPECKLTNPGGLFIALLAGDLHALSFDRAAVDDALVVAEKLELVQLAAPGRRDFEVEGTILDRKDLLGRFPHGRTEELAVLLEEIDGHDLICHIMSVG